ncbi:MAG: rhamnogalacturonan acetylesterase [Bacteroidales bacterium]
MNTKIHCLCCIIALHACFALNAQERRDYKFAFNPDAMTSGYTKVEPGNKLSSSTKYGYDFDTHPEAVIRKSNKSLKGGFVTSGKPFFFSVVLPEGNYNIRIMTGDSREASNTTVWVESRRLLFQDITTKPGEYSDLRATVNIRRPLIAGTGEEVKRKPREEYKLDWDEKLTFQFSGKRPCLVTLEITPAEKPVTVFLAGNSTVVDQDDDPWASWGQIFPRFLKEGAAVSNQAESGLSLGSFLSSNRFSKILDMMKPGDYLFIEFGHNDQKEKGPADGAYGSYSERMRLFVNEFRAKGGNPVIVSPANRRSFDENGKITNSLGDYPEAARKVALELNVPFIDLNSMTRTLYETLGSADSRKLFVIYPANSFPGQTEALNDNTHFNLYGAYELARCIITGIKSNNLGLASYLRAEAGQFDPRVPDPFEKFFLPASPPSPVMLNPTKN